MSGDGRFLVGYRDARTGEATRPNPKQLLAHTSTADELLYGGAAFGGKSEYLLQEAIATCLKYPGCEVALFRRTKGELEESLILRFLRYVPRHIARYGDYRAKFFNDSILWFHYCDHDNDVFRYQSAEWTMLGIDQAEHFRDSVLYLFSRVRSARGYRCKVRLTANPGNVGHAWLKARYITPPPEVTGNRSLPTWDGEVWTPLPNKDIVDDKPLSRAFIQALMTDNVPGMQADPAYVQRIRANPNDVERRMLEEGDWDVFQGQMFSMWRASRLVTPRDVPLVEAGVPVGSLMPWHVIPDRFWTPAPGATIFGSVDYGYGNPWSVHFHAATADQHLVTFKEIYQTGVRDTVQAQTIRDWLVDTWASQKARRETPWEVPYIVGDIPYGTRLEHGISKSVFEVYEDILAIPLQLNLQLAPKGAGSRKARVQRTIEALSTHPDGFPNWQVTAACPNLIRTLPQLIVDPNDRDDILHGTGDKKQEDHAYDDCSTFLASRPPFPKADSGEPRPDASVAFGISPPVRPERSSRLNVRAFRRQL